MTIYVLFITLMIMLIMAYLLNQKDILSPFIISVGMFAISTFVAILNISKWKFELMPLTILVITGALLLFGMGEALVNKAFMECPVLTSKKEKIQIDIHSWTSVLVIIMMILIFLYVFRNIYILSLEAGNRNGVGEMIQYARREMLKPEFTMPRLFNHSITLSKGIGYVYCWALLSNIIYGSYCKRYIIYIVMPIISLVIQAMATGGRTFFIEFIAFVFIVSFVLIYQKRGWKPLNPFKVIGVGIVALLCFFGAFIFLGMLGNRFHGQALSEVLSFYTGLSIPSLDAYLKGGNYNEALGEETLYGIYRVIGKFGYVIPDLERHLEFVRFGSVSGNVYTSLRRYINDFGYLGMGIIQFGLGMFYSILYNIIKRIDCGFLLIIYGMLAFPLVMQSIDELIISSNVSLAFFNQIIYTGIVYFIIIKKLNVGYHVNEN